MKILGIDPGSLRTGWGIVNEESGILSLVDCGIIRTTRADIADTGFSARLALIYSGLCEILAKYEPEECGMEQVFTAQNAASALKLGQARGVAVAACANYSVPIFDYEPTLVKKSLVGTGRAEKEQVAFMVCRLLNIKRQKWPLDITDALATAICHSTQKRFHVIANAV